MAESGPSSPPRELLGRIHRHRTEHPSSWIDPILQVRDGNYCEKTPW
jgi:hypothetical protein